MAAAPLLRDYNANNILNQTGFVGQIQIGWSEAASAWQPLCTDWFPDISSAVTTNGAKLDAVNDNITGAGVKLQTIIDRLTTEVAQTDQIEALLTSLKASVDGLIMSESTSIVALSQTITLGVLGNTLIRTGAGKVYAFQCTGIVEIRDGATVLWTTVGGTNIPFTVPLTYSTSLRVYSALGAGISIQYK